VEISCKIKNGNGLYDRIFIRKFYQVIFLNDDLQSLDIYTAIVASGGKRDQNDCNYVTNQFNLEVDICLTDNELKVKDSHAVCVAEKFTNEPIPIRKVWGEGCRKISTNQNEFRDAFNEIFNPTITFEEVPKSKYTPSLLIRDPEKEKDDTEYNSMAYILNIEESGFRLRKSDEGANYTYNITCSAFPDEENALAKYELLTWTKVTFLLSDKKISDKDNPFSYTLDMLDRREFDYFFHDVKTYFVMPNKYEAETTEAKLSTEKGDAENRNNEDGDWLRPFDPSIRPAFFSEWVREKSIESKKYYALTLQSSENIGTYEKVSINFPIASRYFDRISELVKGIVITAVFAFGIDATRISEVSRFFPFNNHVPADIVWLLICVTTLVSLYIHPKRKTINKRRGRLLKIISSGVLLFWFVVVFVFIRAYNDWFMGLLAPLSSNFVHYFFIVLQYAPFGFFIIQALCFALWKKHYDFSLIKYMLTVLHLQRPATKLNKGKIRKMAKTKNG